jgi:hypothetical protein
MKNTGMSEKELKLVAAARREAAARRNGSAPPPPPPAKQGKAPRSPLDGRTVVGWDHPAAQTTPLDQATVAGWDHPAAVGTAGPDADAKWSRIAKLMESERAAATEKRRRLKRRVNIAFGVLAVVVVLIAARALLGR